MLAFAAPCLGSTLLIAPVFSFLPSYYALHTAATLAQIGAVFLFARILDAIVDPIVGILSDRTRTRFGARIPWMAAGVALSIPAAYFLFSPPAHATAIYFLFASTAVMLGWSMMTIPHDAWAVELTSDYNTRSKLFGIKNALGALGGMGFYLLPAVMAPFTGTTEINAKTMFGLFALVAVIAPLALLTAALFSPRPPEPIAGGRGLGTFLKEAIQALLGNRPLQHFVLITFVAGTASGMSSALFFLYVQDYMQLGASFYILALIPGIVGIISVPAWLWLAQRFDKQRAWGVSILLGALTGLGMAVLQPGPASLTPLLLIMVAVGVLSGVSVALPASVLADVADYEYLKSRAQSAGKYFALLSLMSKVNAAIGTALAFWIASLLGYTPGAAGGGQQALLVPFALLPSLLAFIAGALILAFPITRARQRIISRRLEQLRDRAARIAAAGQ